MLASKLPGLFKAYLGEFSDKGFTAREERDEVVIEHDGQVAARINSHRANVTEMRSVCQQHLLMDHGVFY